MVHLAKHPTLGLGSGDDLSWDHEIKPRALLGTESA